MYTYCTFQAIILFPKIVRKYRSFTLQQVKGTVYSIARKYRSGSKCRIFQLNIIWCNRSPVDADIVIKVNTTTLESSGAWINVSWSGVPTPVAEDWIGVYSPPVNGSIDPAAHAPVKYQVCMSCIYFLC